MARADPDWSLRLFDRRHARWSEDPVHEKVLPAATAGVATLDGDLLHESAEDLARYLRIGIFNRSYYEETLIVRVHQELLAKQKLPPELVTKRIWSERFEDIRNIERYLTRNGVIIRKFFLHVSKEEQLKRSSAGWTSRRNTGSFPRPTPMNAGIGTTT